ADGVAARPVPDRPHDPTKGVPMSTTLLELGGSSVTEHLGGEQTAGASALMEFRIEPGYPVPPRHVHTHEDEITYVLEGEVDVAHRDSPARGGVRVPRPDD